MRKTGGFKSTDGKSVDLQAMFSDPNAHIQFRTFGGFWQRIAALVVDALILAAFLLILKWLISLFAWNFVQLELLFSFIAATLYFGLLNSRLSGGQTIGKKLLKILVVTGDNEQLSLPISFLRAFLLTFPIYIYISEHSSAILVLLSTIMIISLVYFYLVNQITLMGQPSGQTYYDLLLGTYVVNNSPDGVIRKYRFWRWHFLILLLILFFVYNGSWAAQYFINLRK